MKLQQNSTNKQMTFYLPSKVCHAIGWEKGTKLNYKIEGKGKILIYSD